MLVLNWQTGEWECDTRALPNLVPPRPSPAVRHIDVTTEVLLRRCNELRAMVSQLKQELAKCQSK